MLGDNEYNEVAIKNVAQQVHVAATLTQAVAKAIESQRTVHCESKIMSLARLCFGWSFTLDGLSHCQRMVRVLQSMLHVGLVLWPLGEGNGPQQRMQ